MAIISASLNDNILKQMIKLEKDMGFSGRSEVIRAGVRLLIADQKEKTKLTGNTDAVMIVIHDEHHAEEFSKLRHTHEKLIKTQLHNHLSNHKCLELFVLNGDGSKVKAMLEAFQRNKKIEFAKLFVA